MEGQITFVILAHTKVRKMNPNNAKAIWAHIRKAGDALKDELPPSPRHPSGRNPYAHVAKCVKSHFGCSYKEIEDSEYERVIEFIDWIVANPF